MANLDIAHQRLHNQRLSSTDFLSPAEVVRWLGAVQAQDYYGAKWALALRMQNGTDAAIERAFAAGAILRTHVMRPTWHFVAPEDIRWMLMLTSRGVNAANAYYYRKLGLDDALFRRSQKALVKALKGGRHLTRQALRDALAKSGIATDAPTSLGHILARAELDAIICSGPRKGKQFTYALLDERVKPTRTLSREQSLSELTKRYFTSHGPATMQDFAWWSGLTIADIKMALEMVQHEIVSEVVSGKTYWFPSSMPVVRRARAVHLLPPFDEYLVAYKDRSASVDASQFKTLMTASPIFDAPIVVGGRVAGAWRRTFKDESVIVSIRTSVPFGRAEKQAVADAARRYGEFLGLTALIDTFRSA